MCTALAMTHLLVPSTVVAMSLVAAASGWAVDRLRHRTPPAGLLPTSRRVRRAWLVTLGLLVAAGLFILLPSHLRLGSEMIPASSTVWYYAHMAHEVAEEGGFPEQFAEWGSDRPFQTDYAPFTAHSAAAFQLMSNDLLASQEAYRLAVLLAVLIFATLVFRRFVPTWIAILGAVLLVTTIRLEFKLLAYKPEMFAFALALAAVWLVDRAATERSWRLAAVATGVSGLVFLAHAEVFLVLAALIAAVALTRGPIRVSPGRFGIRPSRRWAGGILALLVLAGAGFIGILGNAAIAGEFRLVGYVADGEELPATPPDDIPANRMPVDWVISRDPTWTFYVAAAAPGELGAAPPTRFTDRRLLPRAIVHVWSGLDGEDRQGLILLFGLVAAPFIAWPWLDPRRRRLLLIAAAFGVALFVGSWLLNEIATTYVPRRAGGRRLMPYELILPVVAGVIWLWAAQRLLAPGWRALIADRGRAAIVGAVALALIVGAAVAPVRTDEDLDEAPGLTATGFAAYEWIRDNVPQDARILANAYTDGAMTALTERTSILDGRAVYLENAEFLDDATRLVLGARRYFQTPGEADVASYVDEVAVDYLLVVGPGGRGADVGGYRAFPTDYAALDASPRLQLEHVWGNDVLRLYRVTEPVTATRRS
ncbi:MAG TPA: hypothetical protein VFV72_16810 [Candidatus Limnocylindrales bacterium]|nr:hypothetical protein [Candidatus Limnocylindrales bacterium]